MSDRNVKIDADGFGVAAICVLFTLLWMQSGWYRIDCALKVQRACDLIAIEYAKKERP